MVQLPLSIKENTLKSFNLQSSSGSATYVSQMIFFAIEDS